MSSFEKAGQGPTIRKLRAILAALSFLAVMIASLPLYAIDLPGNGFYPGWRKAEASRNYESKNLYGYIDGGAELFLEFGFNELVSQRYHCGEEELSLDLYEMASADAALAAYLAKKGEEQPITAVPCRNTGGTWQITALKGRCFIQVTNLSGEEKILPVMIELMQTLLAHIPEEAARDWLNGLPGNRIPGSELLVAGPYSMQMFYTLAEGDVLQLGGKVMGIGVDLLDANQRKQTFLRIAYPDSAAARSAFENVKSNLDEYLTQIEAGSDTLTFQDYKGEFGRVLRSRSFIEMELHLSQL
jgi:hypothetical protein